MVRQGLRVSFNNKFWYDFQDRANISAHMERPPEGLYLGIGEVFRGRMIQAEKIAGYYRLRHQRAWFYLLDQKIPILPA
jgi:hypothetical protein